MRYQALGQACHASEINSLLLAHHADDQAETLLFRLTKNSGFVGLRGMRGHSPIPECHGLYGISESGNPSALTSSKPPKRKMLVEDGGVELYRPLLAFDKAQLTATCQEQLVDWVEDKTNDDYTLTPRNTIRHLLQESRLPAAVRADNLQRVARAASDKETRLDELVQRIYNDSRINLDLASGAATVEFPQDVRNLLTQVGTSGSAEDDSRLIAARLLRKVLLLVSPQNFAPLQKLEFAAKLVFPFLFDETETRSTTVGGVLVEVDASCAEVADPVGIGQNVERTREQPLAQCSLSNSPVTESSHTRIQCRVSRARPTSRQINSEPLALTTADVPGPSNRPEWTAWRLFDGRYWIRLRHAMHPHQSENKAKTQQAYVVRFCTREDLHQLSGRIKSNSRTWLDKVLRRHAPGNIRFTLPAVILSTKIITRNGMKKIEDKVIALPSIGWSREGWREYRDEQSSDAWRKDRMQTGSGTLIEKDEKPKKMHDVVEYIRGLQEEEEEMQGGSWQIRYKKIDFGGGNHHVLAP